MLRRAVVTTARVRHPDDTRTPEDILVPDSRPARWTKTQTSQITRLINEVQNSRNNQLSREGREKLTFVRRKLFPFLRFDMKIDPRLNDYAKIGVRLQEVIQNNCGLPADIVATARLLYEKFESEGWDASTSRPRITEGGPRADHAIWGINGIMHGAIIATNGKRINYKLDDRYRNEQRDSKVYGHNGLSPGDWFPRMVIAQFKGAHSGGMRGICGDPENGAYSIVVSGQYDEDLDEGEVLYYSGEGAEGNKNPQEVERRAANESLVASCHNGRSVRVLRNATKGERERPYSPKCGSRYDGLYRVVAIQERHNANGGLYQRFKLRRLPDQEDLGDILARSPTAAQKRDFKLVKQGY